MFSIPPFFLLLDNGWMGTAGEKVRVIVGVICTLLLIHFVPSRPVVSVLLVVAWSFVFAPVTLDEVVLFVLAAAFFLVQNFVCLKAGIFVFQHKDVLLMPYYEPLLWGFYLLSAKRFASSRPARVPAIDAKAITGLVATSLVFSVFTYSSKALFAATSGSTLLLLALFHSPSDLAFAAFALGLGFVVELFGVFTGLWWYPAPDFLGIPYWFATMWISVGLLGRRFAMPAAQRVAERVRSAGVATG